MNNKNIKELSDILNLDQIEVVKKPILEAHGLPNQCYINQDYLNFEKEKIFNNNWAVIGVALIWQAMSF